MSYLIEKSFMSVIFLTISMASFGQEYENCQIEKFNFIPETLLYQEVDILSLDLRKGDVVQLKSDLIQQKRLTEGTPPKKQEPHSYKKWTESMKANLNPRKATKYIDHLIGMNLTFLEDSHQNLRFTDEEGNDQFVYSGYIHEAKEPIATNVKLQNEKVNYKLPDSIVGKKIVVNVDYEFDLSKPISYGEASMIKYNPDKDQFHLLLKEVNEDGTKEEGFTGYPIARKELILFDYTCANEVHEKKMLETQKEKKAYEEYLHANFTSKEVEYIKEGNIFIGMSEKALFQSIGHPRSTNTTAVPNGVQKQYVYGNGVFVYSINKIVSAWQDLESLRGY
ncbi:MAG: hypothetical protein ABJF11_15360 [Reichenbachiella sp.]|uniref:hypothetical protein n=1 Tax=Reichenbachiella sp. TaxID=2184521 RepID=UPI003262D8FC